MKKISGKMRDALSKLRDYKSLIRKEGGFWTYHGCPCMGSVPTWFVIDATAKALVNRGLARLDYSKDQPILFPVKDESR